ncbi:type II toxin-antitoxin system HigB family toxin [Lichenibacterium ramalinae]|uniref:Type II toxin-antitoxin system HigB family toxin n=2 Tax=Lichenibacterium ramalinae TaxID=2316527 RepID=A0A4Q2REW7_9HYPH|nr:type II toxin-antitoxin system HigB family toxin [Lichenibacterium ramalinae]
MRIIAHANLSAFWAQHPDARASLERWTAVMKGGDCGTTAEVQALFSKAKVLDGQRVRFEVSGGDYRLIASFKFKNRIVFVKSIGTHAEYDRIDALAVSQF